MKEIEQNLNEFMETNHFKQRLEERAFKIKDIKLNGKDIDEKLKQKIKQKISLGVKKRLSEIRGKMFPEDKAVTYKLIMPVVLYKNKRYTPEIITETEDKDGNKRDTPGALFIMPVMRNVATTIMNVDSKLTDSKLIEKQRRVLSYSKNNDDKTIDIIVESYPKLYYLINLDEEEIKYPVIQNKEESNLGAFLLSQLRDVSDYNPQEEKSVEVLQKNLEQITGLYNRNEERFNVSETNQIQSKINQIKLRIQNILEASGKAAEKNTQKGNYRAGRTYVHKDFGKGVISSVKSVGDGFYNIMVKFPEPYGLKTIRVKEKEKPEVAVASGLSESLRVKIRQLILQFL